MKGQGSTEYLVILAVVLVVALIVIGLLGQFGGFAASANKQQSDAYWKGATPLSIIQHKINTSAAQLEIRNVGDEKITLTNISFDGSDIGITPVTIPAGKSVVVTSGTGFTSPCTAAGDDYSVEVTLTYNQGKITGLKFTGEKELQGECS